VLRPSYIRVAEPFDTVVVDAGHGGHDSGARGVYGREKDYNLDTARRLATELRSRNLKVVMTRNADVFKSLAERVAFANRTPNSVFVSIHHNSGPSTARGVETFALPPQGASTTYSEEQESDLRLLQGNRRDSENVALATALHASMLFSLKKIYRTAAPLDRGVKRARYYVLRGINRPAVLVEGGFLTNREEARKVHTPAFRSVIAQSIAQGITNYRNALTKR
jgi:N-acetylmuramoyl-L-alanine amidase